MDTSPSTDSTVQPHATSVVVWDVPSAIVAGERFQTRIGIKCSEGCCLTGRGFGVYDHEGIQVASGSLSDECWPGSTGLHVANVELEAPASEGLYTWSVKSPSIPLGTSPEGKAEVPHLEGAASFGVRVVSHPEHVVKIEAVDKMSQAPVSGAHVVMHPYRTVTDERGVAQVRVAKGTYTLFVVQSGYVTFGMAVDVAADLSARTELDMEPVRERN